MVDDYKYNPKEFTDYGYLCEDMEEFYNAHDEHLKDMKDISKKNFLLMKFDPLFFSIKHGQLFSGLNDNVAADMREYFWGLAHD